MNIYADGRTGARPTAINIDRLYLVNDKNETVLKIVVGPDDLSFDVFGIDSCLDETTGQRVGPGLVIRPLATNLVRISLDAKG